MLYKITNLLSTSVTVEDLGIRLDAKGTCTVRADSWMQSNDARDLEAKRWIRADKQFVQGMPPPSVVAPPRPPPPKLIPQDPPQSQSRIDTPSVAGVPISQESFDRFLRNQEELMKMVTGIAGAVPAGMDAINKSIQAMPAPAVIPFRPGSVQAHEFSPSARGDDPMFIPTAIVPKDAKANIKVQEGEAKADVNASAEALKKARGKRP